MVAGTSNGSEAMSVDGLAELLKRHHTDLSVSADPDRHWALIRVLVDHPDPWWQEIGQKLQDGRMDLWEVLASEENRTFVKRSLRLYCEDTQDILALIYSHVAGEPTVLSRERENHPDFDPAHQVDQSLRHQREPETFDFKKNFTPRALHAYLLKRSADDDGTQVHWGLITLLRTHHDEMWRRIGNELESGTISFWDVPLDVEVRAGFDNRDPTTIEVLRIIAQHAAPTAKPVEKPDDWGLAGEEYGGQQVLTSAQHTVEVPDSQAKSDSFWRPRDPDYDEEFDFEHDEPWVDPDARDMWGFKKDDPYDD
ncbi:hypothetical protein [Salininema proteolyticum]|uniref:DUF4240 domain-containing protein n=1 Tax=Salininema proteolyticum TaxID=1607685 RepID=A0ABV8U428_9ACTN